MKLTIFQSDKGDCLLLSSGTKAKPVHVLVDGGMGGSYHAHVATQIAKLPQLDRVYVSHIDEDHISGILQLMDDAFAWKVFEFRTAKGVKHPKPKVPKPPPIKGIWHNAFQDLLDKNAGDVETVAIAMASLTSASPALAEVSTEYAELAASVPQAIQLSQRIGSGQLKIPHNEGRGRLMLATKAQKPIRIGPMTFTIIGPFRDELEDLREEWNAFLEDRKNATRLANLRKKAAADAKAFAAASLADVIAELAESAVKLGNRKKVTAPNLASLMFLVEEDGRSILLTGDGHHETILKGLERVGKIKKGGSLHVNVLKVQHHGAEFNLDEQFCRQITADDYVFCGNGAHQNPDLRVISAIVDSRIKDGAGPKKKFKLWFNSKHSVTDRRYVDQMKKIEALVAKLAKASGGRMTFEFLEGSAFKAFAV